MADEPTVTREQVEQIAKFDGHVFTNEASWEAFKSIALELVRPLARDWVRKDDLLDEINRYTKRIDAKMDSALERVETLAGCLTQVEAERDALREAAIQLRDGPSITDGLVALFAALPTEDPTDAD